MLEKLTGGMNYAPLGDPILLASAEEKCGTFFKDNPPPVFVDEIQKAPALFEQIKMHLDQDRKKKQIFMCASQHFKMMKGVSESLQDALVSSPCLGGFSLREAHGVEFDRPFLPRVFIVV